MSMLSRRDTHETATSPSPDMVVELSHWRSGYPRLPFFHSGLQFERYIPTFVFAYRTFLPVCAKDAPEMPSGMCSRYKDSLPACDRLDWKEAEMIINATWTRMRSAA